MRRRRAISDLLTPAMQFPGFRSVYGRRCWPAQPFAALPCMSQASSGSFPQNLSFKLCEDRQKASHGSTGRCGQIQCLGQGYEAHPEVFQFLEGHQQICDGAAPSDPAYRPAPRRSPGDEQPPAVSHALPALPLPEFTSRTCMAMVQPRRAAYSRIARFCIASVC
jgi:hypothetical protein